MGGTDSRVRVELSDGERRLYELARAGVPMAEIGVRLGLSVSEVDRRLELLVARLGLPDRLALRQPPPDPVIVSTPGEDEDVSSPDEERARPKGRVSRRSVLIGASAVGIAGLGGAAFLLLRNAFEGGPSAVAPGASPTPAPGSSPTPPTTPPSGNALDLIEPIEGAFERRTFGPAEEIPWKHGIFFMDIDSGRVDGYRLAQRLEDELLFTYRLPGPRYIEMLTPDQAIRILVDRDAGRAWKYPAPQLRLAAVKPRLPLPAATETLVFEELDDTEGAPARSTGRYVVAGEDLSAKATFTVPVPRFPPDPLLTAAADRAVAVAFTEGSYSLRLFSLSDGRELASLPLPVPAGRQLSVRWIEESPVRVGDELGVELAAYDDAGGEVKVLRTWLPWSGDWPEALAGDFDAPRSVFFDLDGSTQLIQRSLRDLPAYALGGGETWSAVEVADRLGQHRARIRSASLIYGDVPPPWRFSGPWFFTLTASVTTEGSGFDRVGYTAWNVETLDSLSIELPPPSGSQWYDSNQVRGPIPDPRNPGVVALGRTEVAHLDLGTASPTGRLIKHVQANVTSTSGADHVDPWSGSADELVFVLGHGGHDGGWPGAMIAPKVERPPFDDRMKFRVARAGDCLNLRDGPSLSSRITNCIPDGTELVPWEDASGATQAGRTFERNEDGAWVAVRLPDGTAGWVSSAYLDWG